MAEASGRVSLRAGERRHSPFIRQRRQKAMPARIRGKSQLSIAREGFLDRRSKRCFWLLLSPQTKVARAGARNSPLRRGRGALRRCAATPYPPPSGAPVSLRVGRFADLTRHRRVIQRREPLKGKANGGVSFNTADPSRGRLGLVRPGHPSPCDLIRGKALGDGGRREKHLPWLKQAAASASAPMNAGTVLLSDNDDKRLCPREYAGNRN